MHNYLVCVLMYIMSPYMVAINILCEPGIQMK